VKTTTWFRPATIFCEAPELARPRAVMTFGAGRAAAQFVPQALKFRLIALLEPRTGCGWMAGSEWRSRRLLIGRVTEATGSRMLKSNGLPKR
jgi:hypothetical protein